MKRILLFLLIACSVLSGVAAQTSKTLDIEVVTQEYSKLTWAGVVRQTLKYYTKGSELPAQCEIVERARQMQYINPDCNDCCATPMTCNLEMEIDNLINLLDYYLNPTVYTTDIKAQIPFEEVVESINNNNPIITGMSFFSGGGNDYYTIIGYSNDTLILAYTWDGNISRKKYSEFTATWILNWTRTYKFSTSPNSANESTHELDLVLSPNPASDELLVKVIEPVCEIEVFDMLGNCALKHQAGFMRSTTVDISSLSPGLYFIRCLGKQLNTISHKTFIKQ